MAETYADKGRSGGMNWLLVVVIAAIALAIIIALVR